MSASEDRKERTLTMAITNTHRAAGRAVTPLNPSLALKGAGGAAVLGSVVLGSFATAQAAPANAAPATPKAAVSAAPAAQAIAALPAPQLVNPTAAISSGATLFRGSVGDRVEDLQSALNARGANLAVDGKFGPRTHSAVIDFQQDNGLQVDGRVGPETRGALNGVSASNGTSRSGSSSSDSGNSSSILSAARSQIGVGYSWGASRPGSGFDCSGLTKYAYAQAGISLPHSSSAQANGGRSISKSSAQPGDLVVWSGHIGIYAGGNKVVDAGSSKGSVSERTIWGSPRFVTYR